MKGQRPHLVSRSPQVMGVFDLLPDLKYGQNARKCACQILLQVIESKNISEKQFLELFLLPPDKQAAAIRLIADMMDITKRDYPQDEKYQEKRNQANWNLIMANVSLYPKYLNYAAQEEAQLDQKLFDCIMDNKIFASPADLLSPHLNSFLKDIQNIPPGLTLSSPIEEHAQRVYRYLRSKFFEEIKEKENIDSKMMESCHDITHLSSAAFLVPVMANFYARHGFLQMKNLKAEDIKLLQIAALFHDLGRRGEGRDWWDHDSGLALYYYLHLVLKVSPDKAKALAEAVANKDAESQGFYRELKTVNGGLRWQKTLEIPAKTKERELLHAVDCLEVQRARDIFEASHLPILGMIQNKKEAIDELAQLITEVKGGISARGDTYKSRDLAVKKRFHHARAYEAIKSIYIAGDSEKKEEKEEKLAVRENYPIITHLYDLEGFKETMSLEKLPSSQLLAGENDLEEKMRRGQIYARAISNPTGYIEKTISKRTKLAKPLETEFEFESRKISRIKGEKTRSGATDKEGLSYRSGSMIGYSSQLYGGVGLIYEMKPDELDDIHIFDINSGVGKKEKFKKKLAEEKAAPKLLEEKHQNLLFYLKTGYAPKEKKNEEFVHNEVIFTSKLEKAKAIYFTRSYTDIIEPIACPYARILLAVYMQTQLKSQGKILPIVEYSNNPTFLREKNFTQDQIIDIWKEICCQYFVDLMKNKDRNGINQIASKTPQDLQSIFLYGHQRKLNCQSPDEYYDDCYGEGFKKKVRGSIDNLRQLFIQNPAKFCSDYLSQKKNEIIPPKINNPQKIDSIHLKHQLEYYVRLSRVAAKFYENNNSFFSMGMQQKADKIRKAVEAVEAVEKVKEFKSVEELAKYKSSPQSLSLFESLNLSRNVFKDPVIPELEDFHSSFANLG